MFPNFKKIAMKNKSLLELFKPPNEMGRIIVLLCESLKANTTGIKNPAEIPSVYLSVVSVYNIVQKKRKQKSLRFFEPAESIKDFIRLNDFVFRKRSNEIKALIPLTTADTLKLSFDLFIFYLLMMIKSFREAFVISISDGAFQYYVILQTIHKVVSDECGFQSRLSETEFIITANEYSGYCMRTPIRKAGFWYNLFN